MTILRTSEFERVSRGNIKGIENIVAAADDYILYLQNFQKFRELGATIPQGAVFAGPRGTGKTTVAKYIATKSGALFVNLDDFTEEPLEEPVKDSPKTSLSISQVYDSAREHVKETGKPVILFQDEFNKKFELSEQDFGGYRVSSCGNAAADSLLKELDGIMGGNINEGIFFIGNANQVPESHALLRPGRLEVHTFYNPSREVKAELLDLFLKQHTKGSDVDTEALSHLFYDADSPAMIKELIKEAWFNSAKRHLKEKKPRLTLATSDIFDVLIKRRMRERKQTEDYGSTEEIRTTAIHEIGHVLVATKAGLLVPFVTVVPALYSLGSTYLIDPKKVVSYEHAANLAATACGGYIAEEQMGLPMTLGASADMEYVRNIAGVVEDAMKFRTNEGETALDAADVGILSSLLRQLEEINEPAVRKLAETGVLECLYARSGKDYKREFVAEAQKRAKEILEGYGNKIIGKLSKKLQAEKTCLGKELASLIEKH